MDETGLQTVITPKIPQFELGPAPTSQAILDSLIRTFIRLDLQDLRTCQVHGSH